MSQPSHLPLCAALANRRRELGLAAADVARVVGISSESLHAIEQGELPAPDILAQLAAHYGMQEQPVAEVDHLLQQFLKQDAPSRGQLFKDFVSTFRSKS